MKAEVVVIGAGFAGLAAADALVRRGVTSVAIVEREEAPGRHASGQNAGMIRQAGVADDIQTILVPSGQALKKLLWDRPGAWRECGSLLLVEGADRPKLDGFLRSSATLSLPVFRWSRREAVSRVPVLDQAQFEEALWSPTDAVVDISVALQGLLDRLKSSDIVVMTSCEVTGFQTKGGVIHTVDTSQGPIDADAVVNASGAWAGIIGRLAGAVDIPFQPYRRHLVFAEHVDWVDPDWPFVWDVSHEYYFRPETGGLLLSPCDETPAPPGVPHVDGAMLEQLADRLQRYCPPLAGLSVAKSWAGLRTFTPDRKFVIGRDPHVSNFYWLAGLGGHGVTGCLGLGEELARQMTSPGSQVVPWNPTRFAVPSGRS